MKKRVVLLIGSALCVALFFIGGCTRYTAVVLEGEYSTLEGSSIATLLNNLGKPAQFVYNADGSSTMQWKKMYSEPEALSFLVPESTVANIQKNQAMVCDFSVAVDSLGKIKNHTLLCLESPKDVGEEKETERAMLITANKE